MRNKTFFFLFVLIATTYGCKQKKYAQTDLKNMQNVCVKNLTDVIVHDIFSPPVSSRIYAYCNLAFYEAARLKHPHFSSLIVQLNGFDSIKISNYLLADYDAAAIMSFYATAKALVFSKAIVGKELETFNNQFKNTVDKNIFEETVLLANEICNIILKRAATDNYKLTRGMPKYSVFTENSNWQQTPPDYFDAIEPNWKIIKPLLLDSATQFKPVGCINYDNNKNSLFYKEMMDVYNKSNTLTTLEDSIAHFWDDNPFVTNHKGHFTFATKKTTPVGHWMGIIAILSANKSTVERAYMYASASVVVFDAFIACWAEKYASKKIRPITAIRALVNEQWEPLLQTPPFPEYPSGHSAISNAAATVVENLIGNNVSFTDTTEKEYLGLIRSFSGISEAANEAGISRFYGGIHFMSAIEEGKKQGVLIGEHFIKKIKR